MLNSSSYDLPTFKARCPEIKFGQMVCQTVNKEFPHYSLAKFKPLISDHAEKLENSFAIMGIAIELYNNRPTYNWNLSAYLEELFPFIKKYKAFNCYESSILSELILKLNGIKNSYTAALMDGSAKIDHVVCFFNKDGSKYNEKIENNKTLIIDPWIGVCDFANNIFQDYKNNWSKHLKPASYEENAANGKYSFRDVESRYIDQDALENLSKNFPNLKLKNIPENLINNI